MGDAEEIHDLVEIINAASAASGQSTTVATDEED